MIERENKKDITLKELSKWFMYIENDLNGLDKKRSKFLISKIVKGCI